MTAAIILAAGQSSRMGRPKALLEHPDGTTFVERLVMEAKAGGARPVIVVGRVGDERLRTLTALAGGEFVANPDPARGQLSSLLCGLDALDTHQVGALLLLPVDVPGVTAGVIAALLRAAASSPLPILRAVHGGVHGHPVLFKRVLFDELRRADETLGARAVVRADPARVLDVDVGDARVLQDVDTPDDYARLLAAHRRPGPDGGM